MSVLCLRRASLVVPVLWLVSCQHSNNSASRAPDPRVIALTGYVESMPHLTELPDKDPTATGGTTTTESGANTVATTPFTSNLTVDEVAGFNPNHGILWPGALVQGSSLPSGTLAAVTVAHGPQTIVLSTLAGAPGATHTPTISSLVGNPSAATVEQARQTLLSQGLIAPAKAAFTAKEFYSLDQAMMEVGANASWLGGSVQAQLNSDSYSQQNNILMYFTQEYYTLAVQPPASPTAFFAESVEVDDLRPYSDATTNPLTYVQSITYGRMGMLLVSSKHSSTELRASLSAAVAWASGSAGATFSDDQKRILNESDVKLLLFGGDPTDALRVVDDSSQSVNKFIEWIHESAGPQTIRYGLPISYRLNYLKDNQPARLSFTTNFSRVSVIPIPQLTNWNVHFHTNGDDKDKDSTLSVTLYQPGGPTFARYNQNGDDYFDDPSDHDKGLTADRVMFARDAAHAHIKFHMEPKGHDTWKFSYTLTAHNTHDNSTYVLQGSHVLTQDHKEDDDALHP